VVEVLVEGCKEKALTDWVILKAILDSDQLEEAYCKDFDKSTQVGSENRLAV
jgi:hypothetical protein